MPSYYVDVEFELKTVTKMEDSQQCSNTCIYRTKTNLKYQ